MGVTPGQVGLAFSSCTRCFECYVTAALSWNETSTGFHSIGWVLDIGPRDREVYYSLRISGSFVRFQHICTALLLSLILHHGSNPNVGVNWTWGARLCLHQEKSPLSRSHLDRLSLEGYAAAFCSLMLAWYRAWAQSAPVWRVMGADSWGFRISGPQEEVVRWPVDVGSCRNIIWYVNMMCAKGIDKILRVSMSLVWFSQWPSL